MNFCYKKLTSFIGLKLILKLIKVGLISSKKLFMNK